MSLPDFDHPFNAYELQAVVHALDKGRASGVFIIDVREDFEIASVPPLPHALVIAMRDLETSFNMWGSTFQTKYNARKPSKNDKLVLYALNGRRANSAASILQARGYRHVVCLGAKLSEYLDLTQNELDEDL